MLIWIYVYCMGSGKEYGVSHLNYYVNNKKRKKRVTHLMVDTNRGYRFTKALPEN